MNKCVEIQQLSRVSESVAKKLQFKTACSVITSILPISNTMEFYVFMSSNGLPSIIDYRIVIVNLIEHITDIDVYVNYLMACLNAKIFVQGNINSMSTVVYNIRITNGFEGSNIKFSTAEEMPYQESKDLLYINENVSMKASLEDETLIIRDRIYGTTQIDLNMRFYSVREVA